MAGSEALKPFLAHARRHGRRVLLAMVLSYVVAGLNLTVPYFYKRLADDVLNTASSQTPDHRMHLLLVLTGEILLVFIVRRLCQSVASYTAVSVTQRVAVAVRQDIYRHLSRLRLAFFDDQRTGALVSSITNDVTTIQFLLHDGIVQAFTAPVTVVGAVILVFYNDWLLGTAAFLVFPALYGLLQLVSGRVRRLANENQVSLARLTAQFLESVTNVRIVRAFNRQSYEVERFDKLNETNLDDRLRNAALQVQIECVAELVVLLGFVLCVLLGGLRLTHGDITLGSLLAIVAYLATMRTALGLLSMAYTRYQQALGAAQRLLRVLDEPPAPERPAPPLPDGHQWRGGLTLRDVTFGYTDGTPVLAGASVEIAPGQRVALVGASGVGKSTVASLILGLYDYQEGLIAIDGLDIRHLERETLLRVVSIVPQEVGLFSGSVRENIAYARLDATDEEVEAAARAANAHEFIAQMTDGYNTFVGDQGTKLSGGQRQRIAIARAILRNPRILILDEATSHVDAQTAALVQEALTRLMTGRTTLIIAHHESALKDVDRIIALRQGRLDEIAGAAGWVQS
jgi:subfamily B ATP-binding cassette protein MsbA